MTRFAGQTAIVTGGGSGFGEGIARKLAQDGARVVIADVSLEGAEAVAADIGNGALAVRCDVTDAAQFKALADLAFDTTGRIDILVNNAGIPQRPIAAEDMDAAMFDKLLSVNVRSIYNSVCAVVPHMKAGGRGAIVNVASTGAVRPRPNLAWYNATKGWVVTATRALAIEYAPFQIRVNAINPVAGATPMLSSFMREDTPEGRQIMVDSIPLGRLSTPWDMGCAVSFLASDEAAMITGVALEVDGGRCI